MSRIIPVDRTSAQVKSQQLMDAVQNKLGSVPNIFKVMAQAPAALEGYLNFSGALGTGVLSASLREQIALTIAGVNHCDYCASAHNLMGKGTGLNEAELELNLKGESTDAKTLAALRFVKRVVQDRAVVSNKVLDDLRNSGFNDEEVVEIIAHIGLNIFTNYFNHIADTEVDFPFVSTADVVSAA